MTVLAEDAQRIPCKVAELTGVKWERVNHKHGSFLVSHVRMSRELDIRLEPWCQSGQAPGNSADLGLIGGDAKAKGFPQAGPKI